MIAMLRLLVQHPANVRRPLRALGRYAYWQLCKRLLHRQVDIDFHGFVLPGYSDSHAASAAYYFAGLPDWWEMRFILDYLRPGDRFLDVGANIGLYSLLAASRIGSSGRVDAFEPAEISATRLLKVIATNHLERIVTVHRCAAADRAGTVEFGFSGDDCEMHVQRLAEQNQRSQSVPAVRLDDSCAGVSYAMAKFDIEGYEPVAIRGAARMMSRGNPPVLQTEIAGYSKLFGIPTSSLVQQLSDLGYDCALYDPESRKLKWVEHPWERGVQNVLAVHRSARIYVQGRLDR